MKKFSNAPLTLLLLVGFSVLPNTSAAGYEELDLTLAEAQRETLWFEKDVAVIEYYSAEVAILHYRDQWSQRVGLVEPWIEGPFTDVDCNTRFIKVQDGSGTLKIVPAEIAVANIQEKWQETIRNAMRDVRFYESETGQIIPSEVNSLTTPWLCSQLRRLRADYIRRTDEEVAETITTLEKAKLVLELMLFASPSGPASAGSKIRVRKPGAKTPPDP